MIIRPASMTDYQEILNWVEPWMLQYPLKPDSDKIRTLFRALVSSPQHFAYVAEDKGRIQGVLLAATNSNAWAKKANSSVMFWSGIAGAGAALLRKYRDWVLSRPVIRVAGFAPDLNGIDPRAWKLAERIGFHRHGGSYVLFQG